MVERLSQIDPRERVLMTLEARFLGLSELENLMAELPDFTRQQVQEKLCSSSGVNLTGARLAGIDLRGLGMSRAKLAGADLRGVDLSGADLSGADLRRPTWRARS